MKKLEDLLAEAITTIRKAISDCRYMREHDEQWAMGQANLLLSELIGVYRTLLMQEERQERFRIYLATPGAGWGDAKSMKGGQWDLIRDATREELLDWEKTHGKGRGTNKKARHWAVELADDLRVAAEDAEKIAAGADTKKELKVARLYMLVFRRSSESISRAADRISRVKTG